MCIVKASYQDNIVTSYTLLNLDYQVNRVERMYRSLVNKNSHISNEISSHSLQ
jgi:hypothetical protein